MKFVKKDIKEKEYLSTGSLLLDLAISCNKSKMGGIPTNCITEFSGTGASGKSYINGELCGSAIRAQYDRIVVDDIERRWDINRLNTFGFTYDNDAFFYIDPPSSTIEECFKTMFEIFKANPESKILYILDPLAALYSEVELKGSDKMGQARAKALQKLMRRLKDFIRSSAESRTIILSNQLIDNVGVMFGQKQTTPGGNAVKHWPSVRVRVSQTGKLIETIKVRGTEIKKVIGITLKAAIIKNSEDDSYREVIFSIDYGRGIDNVADCVDWLKKHTECLDVDKGDSWFKLKKNPIYGKKNFIKYIEDNNLERTLFKLTSREFKKFYKPKERKPRTRL